MNFVKDYVKVLRKNSIDAEKYLWHFLRAKRFNEIFEETEAVLTIIADALKEV